MNILYLYLNDNYFFFILVVVGKVVGNLNIEYFVCMNFVVVGCVFYLVVILLLINRGKIFFFDRGYLIFFCYENFLFFVSYQEELGKYEFVLYGGEFMVDGYYFNFFYGCMYEMRVIDVGLVLLEIKNIILYFFLFIVSKFDVFRNWYVIDD